MSESRSTLRVEAATAGDDPMAIRTTETFDVFFADQLVGTIEMSSRTTYGVKPHVKLIDASGQVLHDGLWEEPFAEYDELPLAIARLLQTP
jgi:hypothetical protein